MYSDLVALSDRNMLQFNRLSRVPCTVNYKDGRRTWAWIIQPLIKRRNEFTWDMLEPLDVSKLSVFKVVSKIPVIV